MDGSEDASQSWDIGHPRQGDVNPLSHPRTHSHVGEIDQPSIEASGQDLCKHGRRRSCERHGCKDHGRSADKLQGSADNTHPHNPCGDPHESHSRGEPFHHGEGDGLTEDVEGRATNEGGCGSEGSRDGGWRDHDVDATSPSRWSRCHPRLVITNTPCPTFDSSRMVWSLLVRRLIPDSTLSLLARGLCFRYHSLKTLRSMFPSTAQNWR